MITSPVTLVKTRELERLRAVEVAARRLSRAYAHVRDLREREQMALDRDAVREKRWEYEEGELRRARINLDIILESSR